MKTIVVTGATSGIGNALVKEFAKDNTVFAGYRNKKLAGDLKRISSNVIPFYIDLEKESSVRRAANYIKSKTKRIDTLMNVAGVVIAGAMETIDINRIKTQFEVNTFSQVHFTQKLFPIIADGGKIINISSESSYALTPFIAPYCASKRALDILFNLMQLEIKKDVKIVSIKPGAVDTPIWEKSIKENRRHFGSNVYGYEKELNYMLSSTRKPEQKRLPVKKVVDLVKKVDESENPKSSYTIGNDAKLAEIISKFPQDWINKLIMSELKSHLKIG